MNRNEKNESRNTNTTNHLDISRLGKRARDADEERGENEEGSEVHGDDRPESQTLNSTQLKQTQLKEETLEEVGGVTDGEDEDGGQVDGEDGIEEPPLEHQCHLQTCVSVARIIVGERPETIVGTYSF